MKLFSLPFVAVILLFIVSCKNTTDSNVAKKVERVSLNNAAVYEYQTGISGDEELATITQQPDHYETSKIVRDSTIKWETVYKYKPKDEFQGTDHVVIKLGSGSDDGSPNTNFEFIRIEFIIN